MRTADLLLAFALARGRLRVRACGWKTTDRADRVAAVTHETGRAWRRVLCRDRQIDITNGAVRIAPALHDSVAKRPRELALELHAGHRVPRRLRLYRLRLL